jgi:ADP-ribosyl-[dinitrogen reductase] hydrolase
MTELTFLDRYCGCLLGLANGDAVGTTIEFSPPGTFAPVTGMAGGGPFGLKPGQWTDDTSMALCLAESLVERGRFDPKDQMERYLRWYRQGYLSSTGACFDIGNTVRKALEKFESTGKPYSGSSDPNSAGNGSLMRVAPVGLFYFLEPLEAMERAADSSRTTHAARDAVDACRFFTGLLIGALRGISKGELLDGVYCPVPGYFDAQPISQNISTVAGGSYKIKEPPEIKGSGHVVRSLEAALWAFYKSETYREGVLLSVNLGDDADTTAAIFGALAGAYYGERAMPSEWREKLARRDLIAGYAEQLFAAATGS